jgi:hypothetical protein
VGGGPETASDVADTIMQKFWDSALALELPEEETDSHRYHRLSMLPSFFFGSLKHYAYQKLLHCAVKCLY